MNDIQHTTIVTSEVLYNISCFFEKRESEISEVGSENLSYTKDDEIRKGYRYYDHLSTLGNEGNTIFLMSGFSSLEAMVTLRSRTGKYHDQIDVNPLERWSSILEKLESEGVKFHYLETYQEGAFSDIIWKYVPSLFTRLKLSDPMDIYIYSGALRYRAREILGSSLDLSETMSKLKNNPDPEWRTISQEIIESAGLSGTEDFPVATIFD